MPSFQYVARQAGSGSQCGGFLDAATQEEAINSLLKRDMLVVSISEKAFKKRTTAGGKVGLKDLVVFTRQLATMVDAGISIVSSLKALAIQTQNKLMRDVITELCTSIETGDSFSDALGKHPKVFNQLYRCMVAAGEKGGMLAEVLARLATYLENTERLHRKVKSALMYPTVVTVVAVGITIFLMVKVVPVFKDIFDSFRGKLPAPTMILIAVSDILRTWLIPIALLGAAAVYGWFWFIKTPTGREFWDARRIKLPIFGSIAHNICLARFTRTFASLLRSGVPILSVLDTVAQACGNVVMEKAVRTAMADIQQGSGISDALSKHEVFPDMIIRMMTAGEQTGKIDAMMERISNHLDDEIETVLSGLTALIEPILIVFLGVVVGGIVICMFLPIFKLSDLVSANH
jgi:type IV pilus assembly protein PilC